jgi:hypothetical protein
VAPAVPDDVRGLRNISAVVAFGTIRRAFKEAEIDWGNPDEYMIEFYSDETPSFRKIDG